MIVKKHRLALLVAVTAALASHLPNARAQTFPLYVSNAGNDTIERFTSAGAGSLFANTGTYFPYGLAFDGAGNLFAAYNASNGIDSSQIVKITPGGAASVFATVGVNMPVSGLAVDGAGNLYAANQGNSTIQKFTPAGVGSVFASTGLVSPTGLAFDTSGNLFVANSNNRILKFAPDGSSTVFADTGLNRPVGLAFDSTGNLYAPNYSGYTIEKFTPAGVGSVFADGTTGAHLNGTYGLAFDGAGNLYVANANDPSIAVFTPGGGKGTIFADFDSGLRAPTYLAFEPPPAAGLPGDFNGDGKVDTADYVVWRKNNGTNNTLPNDNGLGTPIGQSHYNLWRAYFGQPPGSGAGISTNAAVPEPATLALLMLAAAGWCLRRSRTT